MEYGGHYNGSWVSKNIPIGNTLKGQKFGMVDAAFIPYTDQENWEITPYGKYSTTTYTNVKLGDDSQIVQGNAIRKIGQTSGITNGTITHVDTTTNINGNLISNVFKYTNKSLGGDSGGPVYYNDGTNLYLIGMNYAGPTDPSTGTYGIACRIQNVMSALNVTPITNDSFATSNDGTGISIDKIKINPIGEFNIPTALNGRMVTNVGYNVFANTRITQISIPADVKNIEFSAFADCNLLEKITVASANQYYSTQDGVLYNKAKTSLHHVPQAINEVIIPYGVSMIPNFAFANRSLCTGVFMPNSIKNIGEFAFSGTSIKNVVVPSSVEYIGAAAFLNCTKLESLTIPFVGPYKSGGHFGYIFGTSSPIGQGNSIPSSLKTVVVTGGSALDSFAFLGCSNLTSITLPSSMTTIGGGAFYDCTSLKTLVIGRSTFNNGITALGNNAFFGCSSLQAIKVPDNISVTAYRNATNWSDYKTLINWL